MTLLMRECFPTSEGNVMYNIICKMLVFTNFNGHLLNVCHNCQLIVQILVIIYNKYVDV